MNTTSDSEKTRNLVRAISNFSSTGQLLLFVAGEKGILDFCQYLIEEYDKDKHVECIQRVKRVCAAQGVQAGFLFAEVRKVLLALNRAHSPNKDHYHTLGLPPEATTAEVKKAYRNLSMRYHPDTTNNSNRDTDRFLEISAAYHALMVNSENQNSNHPTSWQKIRPYPYGLRSRHKKQFFVSLFCLIVALVFFSLFIAKQYHDKVMVSQLHSTDTPVSMRQNAPLKEGRHPSSPLTLQESAPMTSINNIEPIPTSRALRPGHNKNILSVQPLSGNLTASRQETALRGNHHPPLSLSLQESDPVQLITEPPTTAAPEKQQRPPLMQQQTEVIGSNKKGKTKYSLGNPPPAPDLRRRSTESRKTVNPDPVLGLTNTAADNPELQAINPQKARRIASFNSTIKILSFVKKYTRLYNRKDLGRFLSLFSDNATENNMTVTTIKGDYKKLFAATRIIHLEIKDIRWHEVADGFQVHGHFIGNYTYNDGRRHRFTGAITFSLSQQQEHLKIAALNYVFQ